MTLDDLVTEYNKHCGNPYSPIDIRAGIRAVVAALRDEMANGTAWHQINEILGSDDGEASGGPTSNDGQGDAPRITPAADVCPHCNGEGCTPQLDRRGNVYPEPCQACETTGKVLKTAADVCEWTRADRQPNGVIGRWVRSCAPNARKPFRYAARNCPSCGKPIAFKETP